MKVEKTSDEMLDSLLSFKDKDKFKKPKSPQSPDSETRLREIEKSKDIVIQRRI